VKTGSYQAKSVCFPISRKYTVESGHLINPADPAVLSFLQELPR
jgi:hypothetical protein